MIRLATADDLDAIVALWNTERADPTSCWAQGPRITKARLIQAVQRGAIGAVAETDDQIVGFALWRIDGTRAHLLGILSSGSDTYYRLLKASAVYLDNRGCKVVWGQIRGESKERDWLSYLGVLTYKTEGYIDGQPAEFEAYVSVAKLLSRLNALGIK